MGLVIAQVKISQARYDVRAERFLFLEITQPVQFRALCAKSDLVDAAMMTLYTM
jgi:hypothetical protein